jgi:hypothetical protein
MAAPLGAPSPRFSRGKERDDGVPGAAKNTGGEACALADPGLAHDPFMTAGAAATLCTTARGLRAFCFMRPVFLLT